MFSSLIFVLFFTSYFAVAGNNKQKWFFLKGKFYKNVQDFNEKQKCNMCDSLIFYYSI